MLDYIPLGRSVSIEKGTFPLLVTEGSGAELHECIFGSGTLAGPHILYEAVCNRNLEVQQQ